MTTARSQAERLWLIGGGLFALILLVIGWLLCISPQRAQTAGAQSDSRVAIAKNHALESRIAALQNQSRDMGAVRSQLAAARSALPATSGMPDFLRSLQSLAAGTLTHVTSLTVGTPTDVSAAAAPAAPTASPPTAAPSTSAPTGTGAVAPTTPAGPTVYALSVVAQVNGSPSALDAFLHKLQDGQPRAVLVTALTEASAAPSTGGSNTTTSGTTLQITMQAFVASAGA